MVEITNEQAETLIKGLKFLEAMNELLDLGFDLDHNSARALLDSTKEMMIIIAKEDHVKH